ncbi:MAG: 3'-5' exonuclease [Anaeromyxobacteraceae bacterium]
MLAALQGLFSSPAWDAVPIWALDLELGGLDPLRDPILSVGMLPIRGGRIRLGEAWQSLVRPQGAVRPESIRAHQLVAADLAAAPELDAVLPRIDRRMREGALLVHVTRIDVAFLREAYRRTGLRWPGVPVVDTADLVQRVARREAAGAPELAENVVVQLGAARAAHGLPDYPAHDPLSDALASAELFLVLRAKLGARRLRDLAR